MAKPYDNDLRQKVIQAIDRVSIPNRESNQLRLKQAIQSRYSR